LLEDDLGGVHDLVEEAGDEEDPAAGAGEELAAAGDLDERPGGGLEGGDGGAAPADDAAGLGVGDQDPGVRPLLPQVI
jgi:hypothetical protein